VPPKVVKRVDGVYPPEAPRLGRVVEVRLSILVGVDGSVTDTKVVRGAGGAFDREARRVAMRLKFTAGTVGGEPTPMWVPWAVTFEPNDP
jgi:TonB family protein